MEKIAKRVLIGLLLIISLICYFQWKHYSTKVDELTKNHKIKTDRLEKISETQYKKLMADSLSKREMKVIIDSLKFESLKKVEEVVSMDVKIKEIEKIVDRIVYVNNKVEVDDYYPNKDKPLIHYQIRDTIGKFNFYPFSLSIAISEQPDGTWRVDSKVPEFLQVTEIQALSLKKQPVQKRSPFLLGAGVEFREHESPLQIIGGLRLKDTYILGTYNTNKEFGVKAMYNF